MAKKHRKTETKRVPTQRQISRWERQNRLSRIIMIAAGVFLIGIVTWVSVGHYTEKVKPNHEVAIRVNDTPFNMAYYVDMLDAYSKGSGTDLNQLSGMVDVVATQIINAQLLREGAGSLGIAVAPEEVEQQLKANELPDTETYRDIVGAGLTQEKLADYFRSRLPDNMEQADAEVVLVESVEVADLVLKKVEGGANFTALVDRYSCEPSIEGDLGWLPQDLMPNTLIGDTAFALNPGEVSAPVYDEEVNKSVGYWLIEVTEKREDEIKVRVMLLGSEAEADRVWKRLETEDFASLSKESQHDSRMQGGELGWVAQGDLGSTAFDEVAFELPVNEVSLPVKDDSVQTEGGYWIVKLLDKGEHPIDERVSDSLTGKHFDDWFTELEEASTIENLLDAAKKSWAIERIVQER